MPNYSETSEDQFYYRAKYLKYKQKYLELKGGANGELKVVKVETDANGKKKLTIEVTGQVSFKGSTGGKVTLHPSAGSTSIQYTLIQKSGSSDKYIITKTYGHNDNKRNHTPENIEVSVTDKSKSDGGFFADFFKTPLTLDDNKKRLRFIFTGTDPDKK